MSGFLSAVLGATTPWGAIIGGVFGTAKKILDDRKELKLAQFAAQEKEKDRQHYLLIADKEIEKVATQAKFALDEKKFTFDARNLREAVKSQDAEISALEQVLDKAGGFIAFIAGLVFTFVTAVQKLIRPALTVAFFVLVCVLFKEVHALVDGLSVLTSQELFDIYKRIIITILNLSELSVTFWFISRPPKTKR